MLAESFASETKLNYLKRKLKFDDCFSNQSTSGKLWLLWGGGLALSLVNSSNQHVTVNISYEGRQFYVSVICAKCNHIERRCLWEVLQHYMVQNDPWNCIGDYYTIRGDDERCGGRPRLRVAIDEFNSFIDYCGLCDMKSVGSKFS